MATKNSKKTSTQTETKATETKASTLSPAMQEVIRANNMKGIAYAVANGMEVLGLKKGSPEELEYKRLKAAAEAAKVAEAPKADPKAGNLEELNAAFAEEVRKLDASLGKGKLEKLLEAKAKKAEKAALKAEKEVAGVPTPPPAAVETKAEPKAKKAPKKAEKVSIPSGSPIVPVPASYGADMKPTAAKKSSPERVRIMQVMMQDIAALRASGLSDEAIAKLAGATAKQIGWWARGDSAGKQNNQDALRVAASKLSSSPAPKTELEVKAAVSDARIEKMMAPPAAGALRVVEASGKDSKRLKEADVRQLLLKFQQELSALLG